MNKRVWLGSLLMPFAFSASLEARVYRETGQAYNVENRIDDSELAMVMFYRGVRGDDRQMRKRTENMERAFDFASKTEKEVVFIRVDLEKIRNGLEDSYAIKETPVFMLFNNGKPFPAKNPVAVVGFLNRGQILSLVRDYFGAEIEDILDRKKELAKERAQRREISALNASYYWGGPYWGGGYPWGWGYRGWYGSPYYRPGFSFGIGF